MKGKAGGKGSGGGGGTISMPSGVTGTSVDDLSANNAANINLESGLNSSASSAAASNVSGSSSGDIVFSESAYSDFQDQVGFVEGATTVD